MKHSKYFLILFAVICLSLPLNLLAKDDGFVGVMEMDMMILPGTGEYLSKTIATAEKEGAQALVIHLNTPGGLLKTSQEMIQYIFASRVPVIIYVSPSGSTATSAGVFITMAAHIAAMAPGTSLGAAHPVAGDGKDIEGDMRKKAENMTTAMVRSITEQRGRNVEWVEKAVRESESITEIEALEQNVVDIVAKDIDVLLKLLEGREVTIQSEKIVLKDLSKLARKTYPIQFKEKMYNVLANPQIAALLWLAAVTGIFMELKNPGMIIPGVVGAICLILGLSVSQIIPLSQSGVLLLILGGVFIAAELFVPSGILGIGGIIAMILGTLSLVDVTQAPGLGVDPLFASVLGIVCGGFLLLVIKIVSRDLTRKSETGFEGLIGQKGTAREDINPKGRVFIQGAYWEAESESGHITKGSEVEVVRRDEDTLHLVVKGL